MNRTLTRRVGALIRQHVGSCGRVAVIGAGVGRAGDGGTARAWRPGRDRDRARTAVSAARCARSTAAGAPFDAGPRCSPCAGSSTRSSPRVGERLDEHLTLTRAERLARHAFTDGSVLDLFSDVERSAEASAAFAGPAEARGYRRFSSTRGHLPHRRAPLPPLRAARPAHRAPRRRELGVGALWCNRRPPDDVAGARRVLPRRASGSSSAGTPRTRLVTVSRAGDAQRHRPRRAGRRLPVAGGMYRSPRPSPPWCGARAGASAPAPT